MGRGSQGGGSLARGPHGPAPSLVNSRLPRSTPDRARGDPRRRPAADLVLWWAMGDGGARRVRSVQRCGGRPILEPVVPPRRPRHPCFALCFVTRSRFGRRGGDPGVEGAARSPRRSLGHGTRSEVPGPPSPRRRPGYTRSPEDLSTRLDETDRAARGRELRALRPFPTLAVRRARLAEMGRLGYFAASRRWMARRAARGVERVSPGNRGRGGPSGRDSGRRRCRRWPRGGGSSVGGRRRRSRCWRAWCSWAASARSTSGASASSGRRPRRSTRSTTIAGWSRRSRGAPGWRSPRCRAGRSPR